MSDAFPSRELSWQPSDLKLSIVRILPEKAESRKHSKPECPPRAYTHSKSKARMPHRDLIATNTYPAKNCFPPCVRGSFLPLIALRPWQPSDLHFSADSSASPFRKQKNTRSEEWEGTRNSLFPPSSFSSSAGFFHYFLNAFIPFRGYITFPISSILRFIFLCAPLSLPAPYVPLIHLYVFLRLPCARISPSSPFSFYSLVTYLLFYSTCFPFPVKFPLLSALRVPTCGLVEDRKHMSPSSIMKFDFLSNFPAPSPAPRPTLQPLDPPLFAEVRRYE